jgi:murein DD-endopeptidase MepM/ murein hydrolase activator NlpD
MASRMSGKKQFVVAVVALLSVATLVSVAEAAVQDGAACTATGKVVGVQTKSGRTSFICKAEGKKKVWRVLKSKSSGSSSGSTSSSPSTTTAKTPPTPPMLSHPPIDNDGLMCDTGQPMVSAGFYCFDAFANRLMDVGVGKLKWLPHYTYRLRPNAKIYASMDGTIKRVIDQGGGDLEFWLDNGDDVWMLVYDHVTTMRVAEGARVKAGDWIAGMPNSVTHQFEFQVNKDTRRIDNTSWHICPRTIGSTSFNAFHESALATNNARATDGGHASVCLRETVDPLNLFGS